MNSNQPQSDVSRSAYNWWANVAELVRYVKRCPNPNAQRILQLAERVVDGNRNHHQLIKSAEKIDEAARERLSAGS